MSLKIGIFLFTYSEGRCDSPHALKNIGKGKESTQYLFRFIIDLSLHTLNNLCKDSFHQKRYYLLPAAAAVISFKQQ